MLIRVDRDSVAMGDDVEPHVKTFEFPGDTPLSGVITRIVDGGFLAVIHGGKATWIAVGEEPLAVVAQQWSVPRYLVEPSRPIRDFRRPDGDLTLRFRYRDRQDPDQVFGELTAGR